MIRDAVGIDGSVSFMLPFFVRDLKFFKSGALVKGPPLP